MGIFDGFKKKNKQQSVERVENGLLEIIKIVSFQNTGILKQAQECIENTSGYYKDHIEDFESRGLSMEDEISFLQWIGCIDLLLNNEFVCECDWKESNCVVAAFDIDSDSYVMFPCKKDDIERLSELAEGFGYRIDLAKNM